MNKICRQCQQAFQISETDLRFLDKASVPPPSHCYFCRMLRRLCNRNERHLYHRKCSKSGKQIISNFSTEKKFPVYDIDQWWADDWDALDYGRQFDFNRNFFDQFKELQNVVPRLAMQQQKPMENSAYCNCASSSKNCYLTFSTNNCEDCYYGSWVNKSKSCIDCSSVNSCELCYECVNCRDCYNLRYSHDCSNCSDSMFLKDCIGCKNCFASHSLTNQQYTIFNKQVGKEKYLNFIAAFDSSSYSQIEVAKERFGKLAESAIVKEIHGSGLENSNGDYLRFCQNVSHGFECDNSQDLSYCMCIDSARDCMDYSYWGNGAELIYECQACGYDVYNLKFCNLCWTSCSNLTYCDHCFKSKNCFGCVGLRNKEFCIFNQQFSKEEYHKQVEKITAHMKKSSEWGEFFPTENALFCYNESLAMEQMPMSKSEVQSNGWSWLDPLDHKKNYYSGPEWEFSDSIQEISRDVCTKVLKCIESKKPYKIIEPEFDFYIKHKIPLPRLCPDQRHLQRLYTKNPRILWQRKCSDCEKDISTSYAPGRKERVFCSKCYEREIYS